LEIEVLQIAAFMFLVQAPPQGAGINLKSSISNPQAAPKSGCSQSQIYNRQSTIV